MDWVTSPVDNWADQTIDGWAGAPLELAGFSHVATGAVYFTGTHPTRLGLKVAARGGVAVKSGLILNPSNLLFNVDLGIFWKTNAKIILDEQFAWNTGALQDYWYQIIGTPRDPDECKNPPPCCQRFVMNVHAPTMTDLCKKLRQRQIRWKIDQIHRWSRPVHSTDPCNKLEPVDVRTLVCDEFLVDFDLVDKWGGTVIKQFNSFLTYVVDPGQSSLSISGQAAFRMKNDWQQIFKGGENSPLQMTGEATAYSYPIIPNGGAVCGGTAYSEFSDWHYVGGDLPDPITKSGSSTELFFEYPDDNDWAYLNNVFTTNSNYATVHFEHSHTSSYLVVKGFDFNLPPRVVIGGFAVNIVRHANTPVFDDTVAFVVNDEIVSDNMAIRYLQWPLLADSMQEYGGPMTIWRDSNSPDYLGPWSVEDVNDPSFGVAIRVRAGNVAPSFEALVDSIIVTVYYIHDEMRLAVGGTAKVIASAYQHVVLDDQIRLSGSTTVREGYRYVSWGRNENYDGLQVAGTYRISLSYTSGGGITIAGHALFVPGGVALSGMAKLAASQNHWEGSGSVGLVAGTAPHTIDLPHRMNGSISISGHAGVNDTYVWRASGSVLFQGTVSVTSSNWIWKSDGNVIFIGNPGAEVRFGSWNVTVVTAGVYDFWEDFDIKYVDTTQTGALSSSTDLISRCECDLMSLVLPYHSNAINQNKLSQFMAVNGLKTPVSMQLMYSGVEDAWLHNLQYRGISPATAQSETWTAVSYLQCVDDIGGQATNGSLWKFTFRVVRSMPTEDLETHFMVLFPPDQVCDPTFHLRLTYNVKTGTVVINPQTVVYEALFVDEIGLFKVPYWNQNPQLIFELSQTMILSESQRIAIENQPLPTPMLIFR